MANPKNQKSKPNNQSSKTVALKKSPFKFRKASEKRDSAFVDKRAMKWIIWGGALVTLVFWSSLNDPFNSSKILILSICAFWLLGWLLFQIRFYFQESTLKWATISAGAFLLSLSVAWIATDNKYIGMFGEYGRRTGFLTYLSFIIFFLASAYLIRLHRIAILEKTVLVVGLITGLYGFLQHYNIDFINWNNPYNSVLSTLGNPDFAAAAMAIFLVLNFGIAIQANHRLWFRAVAGFNTLLLLVVIIFSQVRQGLLAAALGVAIIALVWVYQRQKIAAYILGGLSIFAGIFVIAGMLNTGPLTKYFYKISVTYRGDYWRAGWRMFVHHPLFGVGLDRFGAYFRQYRDATQSLRRGPLSTVNAAHDVPIQLAATGGIFVLVTFLVLTGFILWRGIVALGKAHGSQQILVAVIFGSWVAYEAQSIISLDDLGVATWGYILGGAVVGISVLPQVSEFKQQKPAPAQPIISGLLALTLLIISILFFKAENAMYVLNETQVPKTQATVKVYEQYALKPLSYGFKEPTFALTSALDFEKVGNITQALSILKGLTASDPHFLEAQDALSKIYEYQKNWKAAISLDQIMVKLDPYDQIILLQLGHDEKSAGNLAAARAVIPLIDAFAPNSAEAKQALADFGK